MRTDTLKYSRKNTNQFLMKITLKNDVVTKIDLKSEWKSYLTKKEEITFKEMISTIAMISFLYSFL